MIAIFSNELMFYQALSQVTGFVCLELIKLIQRGGKAQFKDLQVLRGRWKLNCYIESIVFSSSRLAVSVLSCTAGKSGSPDADAD